MNRMVEDIHFDQDLAPLLVPRTFTGPFNGAVSETLKRSSARYEYLQWVRLWKMMYMLVTCLIRMKCQALLDNKKVPESVKNRLRSRVEAQATILGNLVYGNIQSWKPGIVSVDHNYELFKAIMDKGRYVVIHYRLSNGQTESVSGFKALATLMLDTRRRNKEMNVSPRQRQV